MAKDVPAFNGLTLGRPRRHGATVQIIEETRSAHGRMTELHTSWFSWSRPSRLVFLIMLPMVSYTVYGRAQVSALIQDRVGPNRVRTPFSPIFRCFGDQILPRIGISFSRSPTVEIPAQGGFHSGGRAQSSISGSRRRWRWFPRMLVSRSFRSEPATGDQADGHREPQRGHPLHVRHRLRSAFTASCWRAGRRIQNIRSSAAYAPVRR